jgi:hypothetical protein
MLNPVVFRRRVCGNPKNHKFVRLVLGCHKNKPHNWALVGLKAPQSDDVCRYCGLKRWQLEETP